MDSSRFGLYQAHKDIALTKRVFFLSEESGGAIVEFAIISPLIVLTIFACINLGIMMVIQNALESAAREAARFGITGMTETGITRADAIKAKVLSTLSTYSASIIDTSKVKINVKAYSNLQSIGRPEPFVDSNNNGTYNKNESFTDVNGNGVWDADQGISNSFGLAGQVVQYEISYTWDTLFPIFGSVSLITLTGRTPIMNEDF